MFDDQKFSNKKNPGWFRYGVSVNHGTVSLSTDKLMSVDSLVPAQNGVSCA